MANYNPKDAMLNTNNGQRESGLFLSNSDLTEKHIKDGFEQTDYIHLREHSEFFEPQRSNTFKFVVDNININTADYGLKSIPESDVDKTLELSVQETSVPGFQINKLTINRGNGQMHFAGKPTFKDGQLNINDYVGAYSKDILYAWQRLAYNVKTNKVGLAKDYKRTAMLYELTPDYQIVRKWTLYGCWVSDVSEPNYNHGSDETRVVNATIVYDYAEPDVSGQV